jgi:acyl-CoA synthetase (AMP-forming)/AMP-acid ligase II
MSPALPVNLNDVLSQAAERYPAHELAFISSSAHDSSIQIKTFSSFNQYVRNLARAMLEWGKPAGSVIVVYLTEHDDNMAAVWACLLAGYVPCLQPALSAQQAHKEGHVAHIKNLFSSAIWLTTEGGAEQVNSISGMEVHLLSELKAFASNYDVPADWVARNVQPDDDAILFLTSGSTGFSKAVVHTHRTILAACYAKGEAYGLTPNTNVLNCKSSYSLRHLFLHLVRGRLRPCRWLLGNAYCPFVIWRLSDSCSRLCDTV